MLRPNKYSDPQLTILPIAGALLKQLKKKRSITIADLKEHVASLGPDRMPLFFPSIAVLYLLGVVEYRRKTDCMEYIGP
ncbi:MAG: ABC-three component system middle component 8 [Planctomycetaceae bacterium]